MKTFKILVLFTIFLLIFSYNYNIFADDEDFEDIDDIGSYIETSSDIVTEPTINSRAAIVYDRNSGFVLYGKKENEQCKMASTTKIMTAIIVLENANLDDIVTVSKKLRVQVVRDLVFILMIKFLLEIYFMDYY